MNAIQYSKDQDNIVTLTIDMPGQSANTMNAAFREAFLDVSKQLLSEQDQIRGIILASAKSTFFAGGDLKELIQIGPDQAQTFFEMIQTLKSGMRQLETLGVPVVAAINGAALGGGWEICLACHYRIALNNPKIQLGLPEVTLGLLPGGGGTVRMVRLLGLEKALPFLLEGKKFSPQQGKELGLIHELADSPEAMLNQAKDWILSNKASKQPWDEKGYTLPGGAPTHPKIAQMLAIAPSMLKNKTKGCYPAPEAILSAIVEGAQVDFDTAQTIESRYFTELTVGQVSKNMIGTFWFQLNDINSGASRPDIQDTFKVKKLGVLGAGMMGAGIAYVSAIRGIETVLKDVSIENAEKGKAYSEKLLSKQVSRRKITEEQKLQTLERIKTSDTPDDLSDCDLIIEAVFENSELKAQVTKESENKLAINGIFASNTSTIPITQLATAAERPDNFIGLHFFSPVDKMPLVEIIVGKETSDETLAKAFDYVQQIKKTPIVVNDSRGFFTSRVFGTFVNEGVAMLAEGIPAASIENAAMLAGMPVGPLTLCDEVSLTLIKHIRDQSRKDTEIRGGVWNAHPAEAVIDHMVDGLDRKGKAAGGGFYDYPSQGKKQLWTELASHFKPVEVPKQIDFNELKDRFLFIQSLETLRCLEENVLTSVKDANIGSIFGIGFAAWTGGAVQFVNQYGLTNFANRAQELASRHGARFAPPAILLDKAASGESFK